MNLLDLSDALLRRTSQFNFQDWLRIFACIILGSYALLLARRK
jgi:hypothetical protein